MLLTHAPHEQRVIDERKELDQKIYSLGWFMYDDFGEKDQKTCPKFAKLPEQEQARMHRQLAVMREYSAILGERIAAFPLPEGLARVKPTSGTVELDNPTDGF